MYATLPGESVELASAWRLRVLTVSEILMQSVYLKCLVLASRAHESDWLLETLLPCLYQACWSGVSGCAELDAALFEIRTWLGRPQLRCHVERLLSLFAPHCVGSGVVVSPNPPSAVEKIKRTRCAYTLASWVLSELRETVACSGADSVAGVQDPVPGRAAPDLGDVAAHIPLRVPTGRADPAPQNVSDAVALIAREARLPENSSSLTPTQFLSACKRRRVGGAALEEYLESAAFLIGL